MADTTHPDSRWTAEQTRQQFAAIAHLRWRVTVNSFRRKGGTGDLVARILTYPLLAAFALGPTVGVGFGAFYFAANDQLPHIAWLLWGTFALCQLLNINLGQPGTKFDPAQLIRFPLRARNYIAVRLFFGLLSPANVIGTMMSLSIVLGICIAAPYLWLYSLFALAVFALTNVMFSRMVFAWVDRWLSTRRAREVFTAIVFAGSMGIQFVNFSINPAYNRHHHSHGGLQTRLHAAQHLYEHIKPFLAVLPPTLISSALVEANLRYLAAYLRDTAACAVFAGFFFAVFALRMRAEFRGEVFSDVANAVAKPATAPIPQESATLPLTTLAPPLSQPATTFFGLPATLPLILGKEFLYVRRNTGLFYGLIAPIIMIFLFSAKFAARNSASWIFPAALAYTLLGLGPLSYNSFGLEATGAQFYFMAPVRLRDVFLAKNLVSLALAAVEAIVVFCIMSSVAGVPSLVMTLSALLWASATLLINTTFGNRRSITAPKKVETGRMASKQASPLSGLIATGWLLGSTAAGGGLLMGALYLKLTWVLVPILAIYAAAASWIYLRGLRSMESFTLAHRDQLFEELRKKS
jgi:ABC-2 type transport system permease protein